jgi:hypothetical protein
VLGGRGGVLVGMLLGRRHLLLVSASGVAAAADEQGI